MAAIWTDVFWANAFWAEIVATGLALHLALLKQLLLLVAVGIFVFSLDEFAMDGFYLLARLSRRLARLRRPDRHPTTAEALVTPDADWIAILVPALREADVIGPMLRRTLRTLRYPRYRILVGTYPDDAATQDAVRAVAAEDGRVICIVGDEPSKGSSKAANLNVLHAAVLALEARGHPRFTALVLHDAEDLVHPLELWVFNHFIPDKAMVQLPVVPLRHPRLRWWGHTYLEEFAIAHRRDMVVREWLGASLPSAGVGCAFSRAALDAAACDNDGRPFRTRSKTEDYELGISLGLHGFPTAMVRLRASQRDRSCVATRGYFPDGFNDAVRQRGRWLQGITLAGWRRFGWRGSLADRYMFLRDRKALVCTALNVAALALSAHLALLWLAGWPGFALLVAPGGLLETLLQFNLAALIWRSLVRAVLTGRDHGWREGVLSIPRPIFATAIQAAALTLAMDSDRQERLTGTPTEWDKTLHIYPEHDAA